MIKRGLLIILILLISGCSYGSEKTTQGAGNTITIANFAFEPSELTITKGTAVTWNHNDNAAHTIVSQGLFESKVMNKGDEFSFTFDKVGEYDYHCRIHPSMKGKVIVQ